MPFELFVGMRYTRAKRRNHFISFISLTSMLGIALGVAALIVVLSVMNGFQQELRSRILGVASHVQITGPDDRLQDWRGVAARGLEVKGVQAAAPYVNAQGMLAYDDVVRGALVRGVLPEEEAKVADIAAHMKFGSLSDLRAGEFGIVLGSELARALQVMKGGKVVLIAPQGQVTPAGILPRLKQFTVVGIFEVGMFEYDNGLALIHIEDAERLYRMEGSVSGVRLRLADLYQAPRIARELSEKLAASGDYFVSDWTRSHANFFRAVAIEKNVMFIILLLIVAVAAFNIVSTLVMMVTDKQSDIAILRTLGAAPYSITRIFIIQGAVIGVIGTLIGVVGGIILALNVETVVPAIEHWFGVHILPADVYYISELPSQLQWKDVATITLVSLLLSFIATIYPSYRASRVNPAEALRYE